MTVNENIKISLVDAYSQGLLKLENAIDSNQKKMDSFAGAAKTAATGLAAVAGTQMALNLLNSAKNWGGAIDEIQDKTGLAGQAASELLVISNTVGLSNEEMGQAIMKMSKTASIAREALLSARDAGKESTDAFSKWGIQILDDNDNLLDADQILRNVTQRHREMADGTAKNAMEMELFGRSGGKMKDMLDLTDDRIAEFIKHAKAAGLIVGDDFAPAMEKLQQDTNLVNLEFEGLKMQLGMQLMPQFISLEQKAQDIIDTYGQLDESTKDLIAESLEAGIVIAGVGAAINAVIWLGTPFVGFAKLVIGALDAIAVQAGITHMALLGPVGIGAALIGGTNAYLHSQPLPDYEQTRQTFENQGLDPDKYISNPDEWMSSGSSDDYDTTTESFNPYADTTPEPKPKSQYSGGATHINDTGGGASKSSSAADKADREAEAAAKKAEEDYKRMVERYNKLIAETNSRIVDETGTEFDKVIYQTDAEIAKMQEDIVKIQAQGIDTTELEKRIEVYRQVMTKRAAEARRDEQDKWYQDTLDRTSLMVDLEQGTTEEMNAILMQRLGDYKSFLEKELENTELSVEDRLNLERELAETIQQQYQITGQNIKEGWKQSLDDLKNYSFNFEDHFSSMFDSIGDSLANTFDGMVDDNKSITDSIVNSWEDVGKTIQKAIYKAAMEILVVKPLFSWLGDILNNIGGGTGYIGGSINGKSVSDGGIPKAIKPHADGGIASGWSLVGEEGPELVNFSNPARVYNSAQSQQMLATGSTAPNVNVIVNNKSGQDMNANADVKFNGKEYVVDIVLESLTTNYGGMRDVVAGVR